MEEVFLLLVVVRDESEPFVAHNAFDCSTRHLLLTFRRWLVSSDHFPSLACVVRAVSAELARTHLLFCSSFVPASGGE
jgi:hypothetical protein